MKISGRREISLSPGEREAIDEFMAGLKALYGDRLQRVILFGSKARGESRAGSDLDLLVVIAGAENRFKELERINEIASPICLKYGLLLSAIPVDQEYFERNKETSFYAEVLREGILL